MHLVGTVKRIVVVLRVLEHELVHNSLSRTKTKKSAGCMTHQFETATPATTLFVCLFILTGILCLLGIPILSIARFKNWQIDN
jgi:hypothetical protein